MRQKLFSAIFLTLPLCFGLQVRGADTAAPNPDQVRFFETKIRPILLDQCAKCHGPEKQKGGLRVDSRAALIAGGDTGIVLVPGKSTESLLVTALKYDEDGPKMPPSKKMPATVINDFVQWVDMGAPWPGQATTTANAPVKAKGKGEYQITDKDRAHWAFQPIKHPASPTVKDLSWVKNPIDAFVLAGLEAKGMKPNGPAARQELIRRATYDLTGLPPTPAEVDAFVNDPSSKSYENLIDRLLASPRYGEKWGRHWLDLVRFGETNSYERDGRKPNAWRFRDYVIRSLNADKPYDQFVRELLAGDEQAHPTNDSIIATGYYRLGIWDDEPVDRELARYDGLDDIVGTTSQVFLGLTVDCARCHDHKIDPIPQKDYYRLLSFFHNINHYRNGGSTDESPLFRDEKARVAFEEQSRSSQKQMERIRDEIREIEQNFLAKSDTVKGGKVAVIDLEDLTYRFYRDTWDKLPDFNTLKAETKGPAPRPHFDITLRSRNDSFGFVFEGFLVVPKAGTYTFFLDSDDGSRLSLNGKSLIEYDGIHGEGNEKSAKVELAKGRLPIKLEYFQRLSGYGFKVAWEGPELPRRSLSYSDQDKTQVAAKPPANVTRRINQTGANLLGQATVDRYRKLRGELDQLLKTVAAPEVALCVTEAGTSAPDTFVLLRGNPQSKGDKVEPAFLSVLGATKPTIASQSKTTGRRTALANWIVDPKNPLPARVMANRLWQYHFGRGIVRSSSNFGTQGDKPTHPELLDWLASEFIAKGWHLKSMHKLIMLSNTYQMSSRAQQSALASDPTNNHLWRYDMRRLSAEEIRDSILAVCGNLNTAMEGPGVFPTIPAEVLAGQSVPGSGWGKSSPEEEARRSVYIHVKRSLLTPVLESFDVAETDRSTPNRFASTQPTQALAMLNGTFLNHQAEIFAARLKKDAGDDTSKQVALAIRLVAGRDATQSDLDRGTNLISSLKAKLGPEGALKSFCLVALNLNEFLYVD